MLQDTLMKKVAEVAPTHYDYLVKTAGEIRQSPFRDEVVSEMAGIMKAAEDSQQKIAFSFGAVAGGIGNAASHVGNQPLVKYIGSTVAAGVALSLASDLYEAARRGLTKSRHWSNMLEQDPSLAEQSKTDPMVKTVFTTLHRFNPEFSGDPHVAASFVKNMLEYPGDTSLPQQLVKSHAEFSRAEGLRAPGGIQLKGPFDAEEQQLRMEGQRASTNNAKASAFKTRQDGMKAYNERMGMMPAPRK